MLNRYNPFREMYALQKAVDRMFDQSIENRSLWETPVVWDVALDVAETKDEYVVKASLPGINPDDVEVTFTENTLTIKGETKAEKDFEEGQYHLRERRHGNFSRSLTLPVHIQADAIQADYEAGVLTLRLPKVEEVKPRKIAVKAASPMIEGKSK
ncbi:MAG: Hsp20/alpha crystallin family protein [Chloroflexota bacterium]